MGREAQGGGVDEADEVDVRGVRGFLDFLSFFFSCQLIFKTLFVNMSQLNISIYFLCQYKFYIYLREAYESDGKRRTIVAVGDRKTIEIY